MTWLGRLVVEIWTGASGVDDVNVDSQRVLNGYVFHYERSSDTCSNQITCDRYPEMAQEANAEVWALPDAVLPWDHRIRQRREGQ